MMDDEDKNVFLNRGSELTSFDEILNSFISEENYVGQPCIFEYVSMAGTGKTALFREFINRSLNKQLQVVNFDFSIPKQKEKHLHILSVIIEWLASSNLVEAATLISQAKDLQISNQLETFINFAAKFTDVVTKFIAALSRNKTILFVDSVERCPQDVFEWLAEFIIDPLVETHQTRVFLASQNELKWGKLLNYRIKRRYLKLIRLSPLSPDTTGKQIENLGVDPALTLEVYRLTNGNARANIDIAQEIAKLDNKLNSENFHDYEYRLVEALHKDFFEKKVVDIPEEYYRALQYVSVLRRIDIYLPRDFLHYIDESRELQPFDWVSLITKIREVTGDLIRPCEDSDAGVVWYSIEPLVRKILALKLRFDKPDDYLALSQAAVDYYDFKFRTEKKPAYLIEKLYHLADVQRLYYRKWDVGIAKTLNSIFAEDLQMVLAELYQLANSDEAGQNFSQVPRSQRIVQIQSLRKLINDDDELRDRLGDSEEENTILDEVINSVLERVETHNKLYIYIIKAPSLEVDSSASPKDQYRVSINLGELPVVPWQKMDITANDKANLLRRFRSIKTERELVYVGTSMATAILPREAKIQLINNDNPITIVVDDESIPWELMYIDNRFLGLRVPLGKQILVETKPRTILAPSKKKPNVLIIGVSKSIVPAFQSKNLDLVREEVKQLQTILENDKRIEFDPSQDVLLDEDATGLDFQTCLGLGRYDVIHFAGHTVSGLDNDGNIGFVLYDQIVPFKAIREKLSGSPIVILNTCKTIGGENPFAAYEATISGSRAFIEGGALGCVSSMWNVDDKSAAIFTKYFYPDILNGISVGEALRRTKEKMRTEQAGSLAWAGYILLGQPDLKIMTF